MKEKKLSMAERAAKLGLRDIGYPKKRDWEDGFSIERDTNLSHAHEGFEQRFAVREAENSDGEIVHWCPFCEMIIPESELLDW